MYSKCICCRKKPITVNFLVFKNHIFIVDLFLFGYFGNCITRNDVLECYIEIAINRLLVSGGLFSLHRNCQLKILKSVLKKKRGALKANAFIEANSSFFFNYFFNSWILFCGFSDWIQLICKCFAFPESQYALQIIN